MRYKKELIGLLAVAGVVLAGLVLYAYVPRVWEPGESTPPEHTAGGPPPAEFRQP